MLGIGATLREKITTLVTTGSLPFYDKLKAEIPAGLREAPGIICMEVCGSIRRRKENPIDWRETISRRRKNSGFLFLAEVSPIF